MKPDQMPNRYVEWFYYSDKPNHHTRYYDIKPSTCASLNPVRVCLRQPQYYNKG